MCIIAAYAVLSKEIRLLITPSGSDPARRNMLSLYLSAWEFDDDWYRARYPDLDDAIVSKLSLSDRHHFSTVRFFEGRFPFDPNVDDDLCPSRYGDVASAILNGTIASTRAHYFDVGRAEGRGPDDPGIDRDRYAVRYTPGNRDSNADLRSCTDRF